MIVVSVGIFFAYLAIIVFGSLSINYKNCEYSYIVRMNKPANWLSGKKCLHDAQKDCFA